MPSETDTSGRPAPPPGAPLVRTDNLRAHEKAALASPKELREALPITPQRAQFVWQERERVQNIIHRRDPRLLVVVGPCSIHDRESAREYAQRLSRLRRELIDKLDIVMRVYFEKPRTTVGWKGLINDPRLDDSCDAELGLRTAREILMEVADLELPAATEFLDPIVPQYIADLVSWAAIGARTTESQRHREMASGLSMPVGFKNGTDGGVQIGIDAMASARSAHRFLGIDQHGKTCVIQTAGNEDAHLVMRGGRDGPNYSPEDTAAAAAALAKAGLPQSVMIDCSHANSNKDHRRQPEVFRSLLAQRAAGGRHVMGAMIESHLNEGKQAVPEDLSALKYGVSITDACLGWEDTEALLREAARRNP